MHNRILLLFLCLLTMFQLQAQKEVDTLHLDLFGTLTIAQSDAPEALIAETRFKNQYWRFRSFKANYNPAIVLNGTLPTFSSAIVGIVQPDGTTKFVKSSQMRNIARVSLNQVIGPTGGNVFVSSALERVDVFLEDSPTATSYLTNPVRFGFVQPLFSFNPLKWDKIVQPLIFDEAKRAYNEEIETVNFQAATLFFNVLTAQLDVAAAELEKENADTLFRLSQGRFEVGRIAETEMLQLELNAMNATTKLAQAQLNQQSAAEELRNFLGISKQTFFKLVPPYEIPDLYIDPDKALDMANKHRSDIVAFQRRQKQAEQNLAEAKGDNGFSMDLSGSIGFSQTDLNLGDAYRDLFDEEIVTLGIRVPIADWGKARSEIEIAESNLDLETMIIEQDKISFEREVLVKVEQFRLITEQVKLAQRSFEVSEKRLDITQKRYLIGKIGITELNLALSEQDASRKAYVQSLQEFWLAYFDLRSLTLYDFMTDTVLSKSNTPFD